MKKFVSKLIGGLALVALTIGSFTTTVNAQPVKMNEVSITTTADFETESKAAEGRWAVLTRNFFVTGKDK